MTKQTALFFQSILSQVQLNAGGDDFEQVTAQVLQARKEIQEALTAADAEAA